MSDNTVKINDIIFTEEMLESLRTWRLEQGKDSLACDMLDILSDVQDYFCEQFAELHREDSENLIKTINFIEGIMLIKTKLKPFCSK